MGGRWSGCRCRPGDWRWARSREVPRPLELLVIVLAYAAVQGVPVLAVVPEAGFTAGLHALLLPGAALLWHLAGARSLAPGG